jgi:two-component system, NarL family, nitrate/nitrite response regulator NarL
MVVRVLVVDRQPMFRRSLEESLPAVSDGGVRVVASTDLAGNAAVLVRRHQPDVALVDLELAAPGALAALTAMRRVQPRLPVLALTRSCSDAVVQVIAAGASGVLLKTSAPGGLVPSLLAAAGAVSNPVQRTVPPLTGAERQLWMLIAGGASTAQIGQALHVSDRTVKRLTARLLRTLGVTSRTEAAALAGRAGLLDGLPLADASIPAPRAASVPAGRTPDPAR